jgi:hypothetical protein
VACSEGARGQERADSTFAALVARLSEPGGYFDTDNLISNERSYLHVMGELQARGISGGVYIGVGPDQNFSYIARIRPTTAFIVDIRRDNMLQHLIFKALFTLATNRAEYLTLLVGRPPPPDLSDWNDRGIEALVDYLDAAARDSVFAARSRHLVDSAMATFGIPVSPEDRQNIDRFHRAFMRSGLSLRFQSFGRRPQLYYPTYRDLLLERDREGRRVNYLASEADFQFVKDLQERDRVIPLIGDLAGPHALVAIGAYVEQRGGWISAFYTSNVEFYLFRAGTFARFVDNVRGLPMQERSVIIRSVFHSTFGTHPRSVPGYLSTQLLQEIPGLLQAHSTGDLATYWELVTRGNR